MLRAADPEGLARLRVDRLSAGHAQRVRFAPALVGNPEVPVLDEPTVDTPVSPAA